jgi:hypothetical protein
MNGKIVLYTIKKPGDPRYTITKFSCFNCYHYFFEIEQDPDRKVKVTFDNVLCNRCGAWNECDMSFTNVKNGIEYAEATRTGRDADRSRSTV